MEDKIQLKITSALPISEKNSLLKGMDINMEALSSLLTTLRDELDRGRTSDEPEEMTDKDLEGDYRIAYDLCQKASYRDALPILLGLLADRPFDQRFHFAAGICFQQLQEYVPAAVLFGQALMLNTDDAASAFRLGESLVAAGQAERAEHAFDMALELINADYDNFYNLSGPTEAWLTQLRTDTSKG